MWGSCTVPSPAWDLLPVSSGIRLIFDLAPSQTDLKILIRKKEKKIVVSWANQISKN